MLVQVLISNTDGQVQAVGPPTNPSGGFDHHDWYWLRLAISTGGAMRSNAITTRSSACRGCSAICTASIDYDHQRRARIGEHALESTPYGGRHVECRNQYDQPLGWFLGWWRPHER